MLYSLLLADVGENFVCYVGLLCATLLWLLLSARQIDQSEN